MRRLVAGLTALLALGLLVVGVPLLLVAFVGNPWPGRDAIELRDASLITVGVLAALTWVVWARFVASVAVEIVEQVQHLRRHVPARDMTVRRAEQPPPVSGTATGLLAHRLIAAALVLIPMARAVPAIASEASVLPRRPAATADVGIVPAAGVMGIDTRTAPIANATSRVEVVAQRGDTLVGLAERHLGAAARWREIFELNQGIGQSDGLHLASPSALRAGWRIRLPADAVDVQAEPATQRAASTPEPARQAATTTDYVVQAGDGPWDVAEALLGDGARYQEVLDANIDREVAPGVVWSADQRVIHPGWVFRWGDVQQGLQEQIDGEVRVPVTSGDTLAGLVEAHTDAEASPADVATVARRNDGTATPDGVFVFDADDPDLIHPGQEFVIPVGDSPPPPVSGDRRPAGPDRDAPPRPDTPQPRRQRPDVSPQPDAPEPRLERPDVPPPPEAPATTPPPATPPPATASPRTTITPPTTTDVPSQSTTSSPPPVLPADPGAPATPERSSGLPAPIGIAAVALASGLLAMLEMARRRRLRASQTRGRLAPPPANVTTIERELRSIGEPERLLRVDVAVRAAATAMLATPHRITAVIADAGGDLTVITNGPVELDEPWVSSEPTATRWLLPGDVDVAVLAESARGIGAPCAAFTPVGVTPAGSDVLVDLEAAGTLHVDADEASAAKILTGLAAGLATSIFAESVHLIGVGVDPGCFLEHPNQHTADSFAAAVDLAIDLVGSTPRTADSTFALRARHTSGENWDPAVVLVAQGHEAEIAAWLPRPGIVLVTVGEGDPDGWAIRPADEWWSLDPLGVELTPLGIAPDELLALDELISWEPVDDGEVADTPTVAEPHRNGKASAAGDELLVATIEEPEPEWDLMVRVFGIVDVVDADGTPARFNKSKARELVAWLATHRQQATRAGARDALWDIGVRDATFSNVVSEARRGLARLHEPPAGADWIGRTLTASLPLHDRVITDVDLVQLRFDRAQRQSGQEAIATLRSAAGLIRGMPFAEAGYLWPDAEGTTSRLVMLATACTGDLAERELAAGDIDGVFRATGIGLHVLPGQEQLICFRMRAHAAQGDHAGVRQEWEAYERVVLADPWSDGEPSAKLVQLRHSLLTASGEPVSTSPTTE